jgi:hypothetical protein
MAHPTGFELVTLASWMSAFIVPKQRGPDATCCRSQNTVALQRRDLIVFAGGLTLLEASHPYHEAYHHWQVHIVSHHRGRKMAGAQQSRVRERLAFASCKASISINIPWFGSVAARPVSSATARFALSTGIVSSSFVGGSSGIKYVGFNKVTPDVLKTLGKLNTFSGCVQ